MQASVDFWDKTAEKYSRKPVSDVAAYQETLDRVRAYLKDSDRVLEIGCGTGSTAIQLAGDAKEIVARDLSGAMIDIARGKAEEAGIENLRFEKGTLFDPGLEMGSFDVVMGFHVLHLMEDLPAAIARIRALLKPDGLFISKTVCPGEIGWFVKPMIWMMQKFGMAPYVSCLKVVELEDAITGDFFQILETGFYPQKSSSRFIAARKA